MKTKALPGFRDFYPSDLALRSHIFNTWRTVATRYGFEEYDGPPLEPLDLYTTKSGEEIVGQLYNFTDKGDRAVALRPEMTPTLARMVAARAGELRKPIRWFSIPQLFRYERQQRGRLREHFQLNCDLIGEPGPLADAEIIALAIDVMRAFGFGPDDVRVRLSDRRVLTRDPAAPAVPEPAAGRGVRVHSTRSSGCEQSGSEPMQTRDGRSSRRRPVEDSLRHRGLRGLGPAVEEALASRPSGAEAGEPLCARSMHALDAMGLGEFVEVDLTIVRGLAYYTGAVFELFDAGRTLRAICGGGRTTTCCRRSAASTSRRSVSAWATWCWASCCRTAGSLPSRRSSGIDVFVAVISEEDLPSRACPGSRVRDAGLRVEYALGRPGSRQAAQAGRCPAGRGCGRGWTRRTGPGPGDA